MGTLKLYHATDFVLPPHLPTTRTLLTVHDLSFVRAPETAHPVLKRYLDRVVPWSVRRADHVIADSQATKDDLTDIYKTPADKITVLLSGVDDRFKPITAADKLQAVRRKYAIPKGRYIFSIGTVQPRKNYGRLAEALHELRDEFPDLHLVIAGGKGWLDSPIYETIERLELTKRVHFIGFVDDDDVPTLYSGAVITGYPSLYEGFGFPILESMACGTPVITGAVSSMPEVAGDAAPLVDPYSVREIRDALRVLLTDESQRQTYIERGNERIKQFTWARAAYELKCIYDDMLR